MAPLRQLRHRRAQAGPCARAADARCSRLVAARLPPGAAQLEVGFMVAEGWDPDWLPGGARSVSLTAWTGHHIGQRLIRSHRADRATAARTAPAHVLRSK